MKVKCNTWLTTGALVAFMLAAAQGALAQNPPPAPTPGNNQNPPATSTDKTKRRQTIRSRSMILIPRPSMLKKMQPSRPFQIRHTIKPSALN